MEFVAWIGDDIIEDAAQRYLYRAYDISTTMHEHHSFDDENSPALR